MRLRIDIRQSSLYYWVCMAPHFGVQIRSHTAIKYPNIIMLVMIIITVIVVLGEVVRAYFIVAFVLKKVMP